MIQMLIGAPGGYAVALVQSIVALAGVCALAILLLRFAAGRGLGRVPRGRSLELLERLPLDARSAICLVKAGGRTYLLGTSDGAAPTLVADLGTGAPGIPLTPLDQVATRAAPPALEDELMRSLAALDEDTGRESLDAIGRASGGDETDRESHSPRSEPVLSPPFEGQTLSAPIPDDDMPIRVSLASLELSDRTPRAPTIPPLASISSSPTVPIVNFRELVGDSSDPE